MISRNTLKVIALLFMLIDHIGSMFFPHLIVFRILGRIAFPIFAYFVAEGVYYTKNRKKYLLTMFLFGVVAYLPFALFVGNYFAFNIMLTFTFSIIFIYLVEYLKNLPETKTIYALFLVPLLIIILLITTIFYFDYYAYGVLLPALFYFGRSSKTLQMVFLCLAMVFMSLDVVLATGVVSLNNLIQLFGILAVVPIWLYNGQKGKCNLKYLFYVFYPAHLIILYLVSLFI